MRHVTAGAGLLGLLLLAGCPNWSQVRQDKEERGPQLSRTPTAEELVGYLNDNARRVPVLKVNSMSMDCRDGSKGVTLDAKMIVQKPRDFCLRGRLAGQPMVEIGSNKDEFWYWMGKSEQMPYLYHCSYEEYNAGRARAMQLPFQPEWLSEALGVAPYDDTPGRYQVSVRGNYIELDERTILPNREEVHKVTVFNNTRSSQGSRVVAHLLRDKTGKEILSANIQSTQVDRQTGAVLPRKVLIVASMGGEKVEMKLEMDDVQVLQRVDEREAAYLFNRGTLSKIPGFDLAQGRPDSAGGLQPTGGVVPR